ncbi:MAG TPA: ABC transporter substrate-binding protein [Conexibacter sp.]|nr:ABC transporter substrate-binding protein [Conexibacter sp.]
MTTLRRLPLAGLLVLAALLAACGSAEDTPTSGSATTTKTAAPIRLGFDSWVGYGVLQLAAQRGYFEREGVEVDITLTQDTPQRLAALRANRLDATATTVDTLAAANARGSQLVQVLGLDASVGGDGIVATNDIASVPDLKGKSVAVHRGTTGEFLLSTVLQRNGLSLDDVKLVDLKPDDAGAAFAAGQVPAAVTYEPWLSKSKARGRVLASTRDFPDLVADTLAFRADFIREHPDSVHAFVRAYAAALQELAQNPEASQQAIAKAMELSPAELRETLKTIRFYSIADSRRLLGTPQAPGPLYALFTSAGEFWQESGETTSVAPADEAIDASFLEHLAQQ